MYNLKDQSSDRLKIQRLSSQESEIIYKQFKMDSFYKYAIANTDPINHNSKYLISFTGRTFDTNKLIIYTNGYFRKSDSILWIQTFIVSQRFLRQGYGTEFFNVMLKIIQNHILIHKIYLICMQENTGGVSFWQSLGFHKVTDKTKQLIDNQSPSKIYIFEKNLV